MGKVRIAYKILVGNLKGRDQFEDLGVDKDMALNMGLEEILWVCGLHLSGSEQGLVVGSSE
jgi:hypothetical protein